MVQELILFGLTPKISKRPKKTTKRLQKNSLIWMVNPLENLDDYEFSEGEEKQDIFTNDEYSGEGYYFKYTNLHKYINGNEDDFDVEDENVRTAYGIPLKFLNFLDSNYESLSSTLLLHS